MSGKPNVLFLMCDQMQGRVLQKDSPCQTPNLDRLAAMGTSFRRAYTPNAVCSPARASLMTGLLPHNHGVLHVTHTVDDDQSVLRTEKPHWAQRLEQAGYRTGYFGKWHIERTERLEDFGWQVNGAIGSERHRRKMEEMRAEAPSKGKLEPAYYVDQPPGYRKDVLYGVTELPPERRGMGVVTAMAADFLRDVLKQPDPWCCFVSLTEPHDPFICGKEAYERYDPDSLELPPNWDDPLDGRPGLYRKAARVWANMSERQRREAMACYYGTISEIDDLFGALIRQVAEAGQLDHTIIVLTSDHGELLGAHGLYTKNISAFEEVYNIPLIIAGPGIRQGELSKARVGLHDLCPTLLELTGCEPIDFATPDSRSFAPLLLGHEAEQDYVSGYAEYHGGRVLLTQRVVWEGDWKYVFNGFDEDELYHLAEDPWEMNNLIHEPSVGEQLKKLNKRLWDRIRETGDTSLLNSHYMSLRLSSYGPLA